MQQYKKETHVQPIDVLTSGEHDKVCVANEGKFSLWAYLGEVEDTADERLVAGHVITV